MEKKNCCRNCRHFLWHYIKRNSRFMHTLDGHCICRALTAREKKRVPDIDDCPNWESEEIVKSERRTRIDEVLREMCEYLSEIEQILKEDCKK